MRELKILVFFFMVLISCKKEQNTNLETEIIKIELSASENSMQPFLFNNGNDLWMSWTEKIDDSLYTMNYSNIDSCK